MNIFLKELKKSVLVTLVLMLICGLLYPLLLTGASQAIFPEQANGSRVLLHGRVVGSALVGQDFTDARFMKSRPSAVGYNTYVKEDKENGSYGGVASGSENYSPSNPALTERVRKDISSFLEANPSVKLENIPAELLTASGSGLDPHISPQGAMLQIPALEKATGLSNERLKRIVEENTMGKVLGIFGEETVNVLNVNIQIAKDLNEAK